MDDQYIARLRLLKQSIRNHDAELFNDIYEIIKNAYGVPFAEELIYSTITILMTTENWSFFKEDGTPSPLL